VKFANKAIKEAISDLPEARWLLELVGFELIDLISLESTGGERHF